MARPSLGIQRIEALHYYVHDLERTRRFFVDKLDFAEIGLERSRARARRAAALGRLPRRRGALRHPPAHRRRGARLALPAQAPRRGRHGRARRRGDRPDVPAARRAGRHVHHRRAALLRRRRHAGDVLGHHAVRRHHLPLRRAARVFSGSSPASCRPPPHAGTTGNRFGFERDRPPDRQLPDHEAGAALDGARARLRAALGDRVPHPGRRQRPKERTRLGPEVDRHVGSGLGREVRQQRAVPAVLQGVADQPLRRGEPRRRRPALAPCRCATSSAPCAGCARAAWSSCRRRAATSTCCRSGSAGSASAPSTRASTSCASSRSWSTATSRRSTCCRSS